MKLILILTITLLSNTVFSQAGDLDVAFGLEGKMVTEFEDYSAEARSIELQSDGKILVSGIGINGSDEDIVAVRYLPNGQLDPEFGLDGKLILSISDSKDRCNDMAVDSSDNILMTGVTATEHSGFKGFLLKLDRNGSIDSTFAQNGIWINDSPIAREDFSDILLQSDGKILLAGQAEIPGGINACILIRLHPDGSLDSAFGENGIAGAEVPISYYPRFAKLNENEEIIAGGFLLDFITDIILIKFNPLGEIDSSFGVNGIMVDDNSFDEFAYDIAVQKDDKVIVTIGIDYSGRDFGMVRYNPNGSLDADFGDNGRVATDFLQTSNTAHSIVLQDDQKIILSGFLGIRPNHDYAIARYDTLGNLDPAFGDNGRVVTDFGFDDLIFISALQADGKLLCAGNSIISEGNSSFSIARYFTQMGTHTNDRISELNKLHIFPNPSKGKFTVSFELKRSSLVSIGIYSSSGQLQQTIVENQIMNQGIKQLDINLNDTFGEGMFFLRMETEKDYVLKKLIIKE